MGNFFEISSSSVSFLLASVSTLIGNTMPVILPLLGLFIAWIIVEAFFGISKLPKKSTYTLGEYNEKLRKSKNWQPANFLEPKTFEMTEEEEEEEFGDF